MRGINGTVVLFFVLFCQKRLDFSGGICPQHWASSIPSRGITPPSNPAIHFQGRCCTRPFFSGFFCNRNVSHSTILKPLQTLPRKWHKYSCELRVASCK